MARLDYRATALFQKTPHLLEASTTDWNIHSERCERKGGGHHILIHSHDLRPVRLYELVIYPTQPNEGHQPSSLLSRSPAVFDPINYPAGLPEWYASGDRCAIATILPSADLFRELFALKLPDSYAGT
jgi:hypothetical protein